MSRCVICGELIVGYGHNAVPVRDGRCCDVCNDFRVIPARLRALGLGVNNQPTNNICQRREHDTDNG